MCRRKWRKNCNLLILETWVQKIIQIWGSRRATSYIHFLHTISQLEDVRMEILLFFFSPHIPFIVYFYCSVVDRVLVFMVCIVCAYLHSESVFKSRLPYTTIHSHRSWQFKFIESQSHIEKWLFWFSSLKSKKKKQSASKTTQQKKKKKLPWLENSEPTQYQ